MPEEHTPKTEMTLTKRNFVGYSNFHIFINDETGEEVGIECAAEEYAQLGSVKDVQITPTLDGHTWKCSLGGAMKVDSVDGLMREGEYTENGGKAYITSRSFQGGGKIVPIEEIIMDKIIIE